MRRCPHCPAARPTCRGHAGHPRALGHSPSGSPPAGPGRPRLRGIVRRTCRPGRRRGKRHRGGARLPAAGRRRPGRELPSPRRGREPRHRPCRGWGGPSPRRGRPGASRRRSLLLQRLAHDEARGLLGIVRARGSADEHQGGGGGSQPSPGLGSGSLACHGVLTTLQQHPSCHRPARSGGAGTRFRGCPARYVQCTRSFTAQQRAAARSTALPGTQCIRGQLTDSPRVRSPAAPRGPGHAPVG